MVNIREFKEAMMDGVELLFIASPTRAFSPTKEIKAFTHYIREFGKNLRVAVFDTRVHIKKEMPWLLRKMEPIFGYAVDTMEKILKKNKQIELLESCWFYVKDTEGPLEEDEVKRLHTWALSFMK